MFIFISAINTILEIKEECRVGDVVRISDIVENNLSNAYRVYNLADDFLHQIYGVQTMGIFADTCLPNESDIRELRISINNKDCYKIINKKTSFTHQGININAYWIEKTNI